MEWDAHSLGVLELAFVREEWARRAETPFGKERALQRPLSDDPDLVARRLQETDAATQLLQREPPPPLHLREVRPLIQKAEKGGILTPEELLHLLALMQAARQYKEHLLSRAARYPALAPHAHRLHTFSALERQIRGCIAPSGEVLDTASERLAQLRREAQRLQKRITEQLQTLIHHWREWLQEPIYTLRGGRYCLPVRSEFRGRIRGIVHDTSMSGATLFVEPESLVELGNRLRELQSLEQEEIEAILNGLSRAVEAESARLTESVDALAELDAILAAGRLALDWDCTCPTVNTESYWHLRGARHPMIPRERVVPIDLELGRTFTGLLITGPNTGGKTVTLKTLGLLTLMTLLGLHLPAREGTQIAIPRGIYADIGDEQSLQQSLSTFSGHIRHIARFLREAQTNSLVLLDEIGAGTDPTEGAALARAILSSLLERGARVLATTHYGELKAFAYEHPLLQNSSMEFDLDTLQPTYRLRLGVPGASHAIEIAQRLGLPDEVVKAAYQSLGTAQIDLMQMVRKLEAAQRAAEQAEAEWHARNEQTKRLQQELQQALEEAEQARRTARQHAQVELEALLKQIRDEADALFRQLRQANRESKQTAQIREQLQALQRRAREQVERSGGSTVLPRSLSGAPPQWEVGMQVRVRSLGQVGTLAEPPREGKAVVFIGKLRVPVELDDLEPIAPPTPKVRVQAKRPRPPQPVPTELVIRQMRVEEALPLLEKYLDDALLAGYDTVRILHGKGTGTLRSVVHEYLSQHPQVAAFELAPREQGGEGVTIVRFR
jgi:DNA mismatch repair protein MutS2